MKNLFACIFVTTLTACQALTYDPAGWRYVHKKGGAKEITEWALRQNKTFRIADARMALGELIEYEGSYEAIEGIRKIHDRLVNDWDGLEEIRVKRESLILTTYNVLGTRSTLKLECQAMLETMKPTEVYPARLKIWQKAMDNSRRIAVPPVKS